MRKPALAIFCFLGIGLLSYSNSFHTPFQYDDSVLIRFNFALRDLSQWLQVLRYELFRPLTVATFAINYQIGKQDPFLYHVANFALHFLNVSLFYLLLRRTCSTHDGGHGGPPPKLVDGESLIPFIAAAFMAAHPLNTESVTYVSSRSILLCSFFYLSAMLALDSHLRRPRRQTAVAYVVFFILAALSKEEAAMLPVFGLLYQLLFFDARTPAGETPALQRHRGLHAVTFLLLVMASALRLAHLPSYSLPVSVYFPTSVNVWLRYLWLAVFPVFLNVDHDVPALTFMSKQFWLSAIAVGLLWFGLWKIRKKQPFVTFWGAWFFLNILPSSSVFPLIDFLAEHRAYLSLFGFCALLPYPVRIWVAVAGRDARHGGHGGPPPELGAPRLFLAALTVLCLFYIGATWQRNRVWSDDVFLWYDSVQKSPHKLRPHLNLAHAYLQKGELGLALQYCLLARSMNPNVSYTYSELGLCYLRMNRLQEAEANYRKALALNPNLTDARTGLASILDQTGRCSEALPYLNQVYLKRQESAQIVAMLADCSLRAGNYPEAIRWMERGIELAPSEGTWYPGLMEAYYRQKDFRQATTVFEKYRSRFPKDRKTAKRVADMLEGMKGK